MGTETGRVMWSGGCSGVDGASLRSLVSLHQSLISFIFSENNHFEATYGNRHDTTRQRNETWNDNVSHMLAKTRVAGKGSHARGARQGVLGEIYGMCLYTLSRPALSNYQMDSAAKIAGYYLLAACEMTLLDSRYSGRFLPTPQQGREQRVACQGCVLDKLFGSR